MRHPIVEEDLANIVAQDLPWDIFKGKSVLIAGANGFLPAYIVETLLFLNETMNLGIKVLALVRDAWKGQYRFSDYIGRHDFELLIQDVCDPIDVNGDVNFIIHAASQASPKYYGSDPVGTLRPNVLGTSNLLSLAKCKGTEGFLFFSSASVYGQIGDSPKPITEDDYGYLDPTEINACYGESKRMGETMCVSWTSQYGVPTRIVRPFHTYGPGIRFDDGRIFAVFISSIVNDRDIVLNSDGTARRTFCYISDAVSGFFTVLLRGKDGQCYNVANDKTEISIGDLAEQLVALFPKKKIRVIYTGKQSKKASSKSIVARKYPDVSRIRSLGWNPSVGLEKGFSRTIRSYK